VVSVVQTSGEWIPLACVAEGAAEKLFRHKVLALLRRRGLLSQERICPRCGGEMRVVGFVTQPALIERILDHLRNRETVSRPPPHAPQPVASTA
jgi:hypothetical protein